VYVDESGIDKFLHKAYGWSKRGKVVYGEVCGRRYQRESFVAAKCGSKILALFCYKGTCNTALFNTWIEKLLVPELTPGQVVVMDNAAFHKSEKTRELIEKTGCRLVFLPPYSPDLNPIEVFWANLKRLVTRIAQRFEKLEQAIDKAFIMSTYKVD
jgi:transposase